MQLYPGIAPLTIATSGGGPGIIITAGSGDAHGWWPGPLEAQGNDPRSSANLMAMGEALTDRLNWLGWHTADWIAGGDYRTLFRGTVLISSSLTIDRSAINDNVAGLIAQGGGATSGGYGVEAFGGGTNAPGLKAEGIGSGWGADITGGATGAGIMAYGGATSGSAIEATAQGGNSVGVLSTGHGSGAGISATAGGTAGTPSIVGTGGPLRLATNIATAATDPGGGQMWRNAIPKAHGRIVVANTGTTATVAASVDSYSVAGAAFTDAGGGNFYSVTVTLAHAMSSATDWSVDMRPIIGFGGDYYQPVGIVLTSTTFKFVVPLAFGAGGGGIGAGKTASIVAADVTYPFFVMGRD